MSCPDPDLERCKKSLRSVLLAFKDGLPMRLVSKEYSNLFEEDIQFSKFKFQSLGKRPYVTSYIITVLSFRKVPAVHP